MIIAFEQNKQDTFHLKLDDALLETTITIPTTGANLACFTRNKISKHSVCPQGTYKKWRRRVRLIKETADYFFIGYYIGGYQCAG